MKKRYQEFDSLIGENPIRSNLAIYREQLGFESPHSHYKNTSEFFPMHALVRTPGTSPVYGTE